MRHEEGGRDNAGWIARFVFVFTFACGAILIIPGAEPPPQANSDEPPKVTPTVEKVDSKITEEIQKAEQELKRSEELYKKKSIEKAQLEKAIRTLLKLKVSALEEELLRVKISLAKSDLARAEERAELASRSEKDGESAKYWKISEGLTLLQAKFQLEQAENWLQVYLKYTRPKRERDELIADQPLDEGAAAQSLAHSARSNKDGAKEPKSERQKLAESRLEQRIAAMRNELLPTRSGVKWHADHVDYTRRHSEAGFVSERHLNEEKLALQNVKDQVEKLQGKLEGLRQSFRDANEVRASKNQAKTDDLSRGADGPITLKGIAREKGTGQPVEGALLSLRTGRPFRDYRAETGKDGRYEFTDLPEAEEYSLVGEPMEDMPYFITSARVKPVKSGEKIANLDLSFVRGIPFRVRVLHKAMGRPLSGVISYFPVTPNDPYKREVWGDSQAQEYGAVTNPFYKTENRDENGDFHGSVLPGPGVLCFSPSPWPKDLKTNDLNPDFFFPDGKDAAHILIQEKPPISAILVPVQGSSESLAIGLKQYTAVIAINPKEDAKEVVYEITIDQPNT